MNADTFNKAKELAEKMKKYNDVANALDESNAKLAGLPFRNSVKSNVSPDAIIEFMDEDWIALRKTLELIIRAAINDRINKLENEFEKL